MKVCVFGLGAIGGLLAARLALSGTEVSAVVRGATLSAVRERGLVLTETVEGQAVQRTAAVTVHASPEEAGPQDLVILSVKTTGLPDIARQIGPLLGPHTTVLSAMNGVPWWFFHGLPCPAPMPRLESVDPGGVLSRHLAHEQVLGSVVHLSASLDGPGHVRHIAGNQLIIGEPQGGAETSRAQHVIALLHKAGFDVEGAARIQQEIWFKLWGNMTVNPISALTGATGDRLLDDELVRAFMTRCMQEAADIGARIGLPIDADPEARHQVTRKLGAFRTSMLQDLEAGRPLELDALVGAVREIAANVGVPTPQIDTLFGLARLKAKALGLYRSNECP